MSRKLFLMSGSVFARRLFSFSCPFVFFVDSSHFSSPRIDALACVTILNLLLRIRPISLAGRHERGHTQG
jgi:hypothetical protein